MFHGEVAIMQGYILVYNTGIRKERHKERSIRRGPGDVGVVETILVATASQFGDLYRSGDLVIPHVS